MAIVGSLIVIILSLLDISDPQNGCTKLKENTELCRKIFGDGICSSIEKLSDECTPKSEISIIKLCF